MQITALTDIVEGNLLNTPAISFVTQIHTNILKINEGDAFLTSNQSDIELAIKKGIFSLIVDFEPNITDDEIAWILVDDLNKAISNILRYKLLNSNIKYIHTNKIFSKFLNIFTTKEMTHVISLTDNLSDDFELLNNLKNDKLIFGTNLKFLNAIGTNVSILKHKNYDIKNLTSHSLFETSFSYKDKFFDKLKIPTVYIDDLLQQLEFFEYKLDMKKLNNFDLFRPIFINKSNQIVNFGQTNKFILANKDIKICDIEINYLKSNYNYGKIEILNIEQLSYDEIFQRIKSLQFNALYIKGCDIKIIIDILEQNYTTHTLTI